MNVYFFHNYNEEWKNVDEFVNVLKYECGMYCQFAKIKEGKEEYIKSTPLNDITNSENYEKEVSYVFDNNGNIM